MCLIQKIWIPISTYFQVAMDQWPSLSIKVYPLYIRVIYNVHRWFVIIITWMIHTRVLYPQHTGKFYSSLSGLQTSGLLWMTQSHHYEHPFFFFTRWKGKLFLQFPFLPCNIGLQYCPTWSRLITLCFPKK